MKTIVTIVSLALVMVPATVLADTTISEIMYDLEGTDGGREWVEVYNSGPDPVDLSALKLNEAEVNHRVNVVDGYESTIGVDSYAVIADNPTKFLNDWPGYVGVLLDSAFSLSNTGEVLVLRDSDLIDIDSVEYSIDMGASGDGNSLTLVNGSFLPRAPTPGAEGSGERVGGDGSGDDEEGGDGEGGDAGGGASDGGSSSGSKGGVDNNPASAHSSGLPLSVTRPEVKIALDLGRDRVVAVGVPLALDARAIDRRGTEYLGGSYRWNFGDGLHSSDKEVVHTYEYPGDYVVVAEVVVGGKSAIARREVRVVPFDVSIEAADDKLFLTNKSDQEVNLGNFSIRQFSFPRDTIVLPGARITLGENVLGVSLASSGMAEVILKNPGGAVAARAPQEVRILGASTDILEWATRELGRIENELMKLRLVQ